MEQQKIDMFIMQNRDAFDFSQLETIKQTMTNLPDSKFSVIASQNYWNTTLMVLLSIFVGEFGVDRFMLGETGLGVLKLITCGGCGIWWLIDLFSIKRKTLEYNMKKFQEACML